MCSSGDVNFYHDLLFLSYTGPHSARTPNGTLDSRETRQECVVYFGQQPFQISSESNVPFPNVDRYTANPQYAVSGLPPIAGTIFLTRSDSHSSGSAR